MKVFLMIIFYGANLHMPQAIPTPNMQACEVAAKKARDDAMRDTSSIAFANRGFMIFCIESDAQQYGAE